MIYGDRNEMRLLFVTAYRKRRDGAVLDPLEAMIAEVIGAHPEYHALLERGEIEHDYTVEQGEANPFLHMALHMAIREQLSIDRPAGIRAAWRALAARLGDGHAAEHRMLECLGETLHAAQRDGRPPDEQAYLDAVLALGNKP